MRRRFNGGERVALYLVSQGKCSLCGATLTTGWHGDHLRPFSKGGKTDVVNGQALCPDCNLKKGARMNHYPEKPWPEGNDRKWQELAFAAWLSANNTDFFVVAPPGAGKTKFALRIAHYALSQGKVERIVVVVPTEHLRKQWCSEASKVGIQLDPKWTNDNGLEMKEFHGIVVTYQTVASQADVHRSLCAQLRTLVILDEIHHAGDNLPWGCKVKHAFECAAYRLPMSGTPFRSDNNSIPFVTYKDGCSKADFDYNYGQTIRDQVCRLMMFPTFDGRFEWFSDSGRIAASFRDTLPEEESSRRLRTSLDPKLKWLPEVLKLADRQLTSIRRAEFARAGGLILCRDKYHVRDVALIIKTICGQEPTVVTYEDPEASAKITAFAESDDRWLIAVRMVSEGVDIPRLFVGVYATNIITELFFRQVVGRFVRMIPGLEEQVGYLYIPADDVLMSYAQRIKEEREHAIKEMEAESTRHNGNGGAGPVQQTLYAPISSDDAKLHGVITDDDFAVRTEWEEAARLVRAAGLTNTYHIMVAVKLLRAQAAERDNGDIVQPSFTVPQTRAESSLHERRQALRNTRHLRVRQFGAMLSQEMAGGKDDPFRIVNNILQSRTGAWVNQATIEQLQQQIKLLNQWVALFGTAQSTGLTSEWVDRWLRGDDDGDSGFSLDGE